MLRVLSLGAGVQSTTVALLSKHGELPALDAAIFADTGWEPQAVYRHLDWLERQLPFPVYRVRRPIRIQDNPYRNADDGKRFISLPMFTENGGRLWRQCTKEFKIEPIQAKIRAMAGLRKAQRAPKGLQVEQWFGISREEASRMRDSQASWIRHRYPLVFDRPMSRTGCVAWLQAHGYPEPPRSACIGCPFHSNVEWQKLKQDSPAEFHEAVEFERIVGPRVWNRQRHRAYLHRSLVPLDQVDFTQGKNPGQLSWLEDCEGVCGV